MNSMKQSDQRGMVSFMITLVMMLVISLIVIGFTQVANRNRRQALDRQLSAQAFYAAESGVNAVATKIRADGTAPSQTSCAGTNYQAAELSSSPLVSYTCVLVNPVVEDIRISANMQTSAIVYISPVQANGNNMTIAPLTFNWSPAAGGGSTPQNDCAAGRFATTATYACGYGMLRVDLFQVEPSAPFNASALMDRTETFFFQPTQGTPPPRPVSEFDAGKSGADDRAHIVPAACTATNCEAVLNLTGNAQNRPYYARLTTLYRDAPKVVIDGGSAPGGKDAYFKDQEVMVDVTGKAQDVLRRVQVRVPLRNFDGTLPLGAIQSSASVCKRFTVAPGIFQNECPAP